MYLANVLQPIPLDVVSPLSNWIFNMHVISSRKDSSHVASHHLAGAHYDKTLEILCPVVTSHNLPSVLNTQ